MKNGKKLSVREKMYLQSLGMKSDAWLISKKCADVWILVSRKTSKLREIPAP